MAHHTSNILLSSSLTPIIIIVWSLVFSSIKTPEKTVSSVKCAFFFSLLPLIGLLIKGPNYVNDTQTNINWINIDPASISVSLKFDLYQIIFTSTALFVTWSIIEFSLWYIETDPAIGNFLKKLLFFLLTMIIIISAGNLTILFVGWEGLVLYHFYLSADITLDEPPPLLPFKPSSITASGIWGLYLPSVEPLQKLFQLILTSYVTLTLTPWLVLLLF